MVPKMCESQWPSTYTTSLGSRAVAHLLSCYAPGARAQFGRTLLVLACAALLMGAWQLQAAPITYTINGTLGDPPVSGPDVLFLAGKPFQITGTIDSAAAPVSSGTGTATYSFPSL